VKDAVLLLRMDMVSNPQISNHEPPEIERRPECAEATKEAAWERYDTHAKQCPRCEAVSARYWERDTWRRGRGKDVLTLIMRLKDYRRARRNYWHSGGRTEMGADRFT
jgi:hypothetical protein